MDNAFTFLAMIILGLWIFPKLYRAKSFKVIVFLSFLFYFMQAGILTFHDNTIVFSLLASFLIVSIINLSSVQLAKSKS